MSTSEKIRLDKWLWAARFFKTRSQAAQAVTGGKVHVNGNRAKPARTVDPGDEIRIQKGPYEFAVTILGVASQRRPASEAMLLYEETEASKAQREKIREERKLMPESPGVSGRPGKRDRRLIKKFIRKEF
jgi:ribosome-associated heat shock protein Hsp15